MNRETTYPYTVLPADEGLKLNCVLQILQQQIDRQFRSKVSEQCVHIVTIPIISVTQALPIGNSRRYLSELGAEHLSYIPGSGKDISMFFFV